MNVNIDARESKLKAVYESETENDNFLKDNTIYFPQLPIGDIEIIKKSNDTKIIILERKTINDLKHSLKDGRFSEQKKRLASTDFIHKGFIIEGNPNYTHGDFTNMLRQIIIRIQLKDRMSVFITKNVNDTFELIKELSRKLNKDTKLYKCELSNDYVEKLNVCKKLNLTPNLCFILQLSQIPGISKTIAQNIANIYPNWTSLTYALKDKKEFLKSTTNMNIGPKKFEQLQTFILNL